MADIDSATLSARPPANARVPLVLADKSIGAMLASAGGDPWMLGAVRVATTTNGTLATAYENGDTVDGVVLATGDRILLKNQSSGAENGIYVVNASGAPTRATDADGAGDLYAGLTVSVLEGTANARTTWRLTTAGTITIGSTAQTWERAVLQSYSAIPAALTADGTDTAADAGKLLICNAASVITRTLPSSLDAVGHWIEYYNASEYPVKISAGTDGINIAGLDYVYVLKGNRLRFIYYQGSDPKWICTDWQNQVATVNAQNSDWTTVNSTTLADVTNFNWRLGTSGDAWYFDIDLVYYTGATTTGIKVAVTLSAVTNLYYFAEGSVAADGVSAKYHGNGMGSGDAITFTGIESTSDRYVGRLYGVATPSDSGALLQLQFASEVGSSNAVLRAHSTGRLRWVPRV